MSYTAIKDQIVKRLGTLGLQESNQAFDFANSSNKEYENTFIIFIPNRSAESFENESLSQELYDVQTWEIQIAFAESEHSDIAQRDELQNKITDIIKDLDNPSNWQGITNGARLQRYSDCEITKEDGYFLAIIRLTIQDIIRYS